MLLNNHTKINLDVVIKNKPSGIALIGERGAGKYLIAKYLSDDLLGSSNKTNVIHVNALNSGIEEVRDIRKRITTKTSSTDEISRVVIIEHFNEFGREAQNAILKTLEEPEKSTTIILTIDNSKKVLDTIFSRISKIEIKPLALEYCTEKIDGYSKADIKKAYAISGGSAGLMMSILNNSEHEVIQAIDKAKELISLPKYKRIGQIDDLQKGKKIPITLLVDGIVRTLSAISTQSINQNKSNIKDINSKLEYSVTALKELESGVNQKLVLTRLFLVI